jgi:hypothetical protein
MAIWLGWGLGRLIRKVQVGRRRRWRPTQGSQPHGWHVAPIGEGAGQHRRRGLEGGNEGHGGNDAAVDWGGGARGRGGGGARGDWWDREMRSRGSGRWRERTSGLI